MNRLQSNNLNVLVNIQYGIGFELIEGEVEIETTIFNITQKSRIVAARRNRVNFYEEFKWEIDRTTLKYYRTTNEIVKIECFTIPDICYGNIYRRQRIGHVIIKLKEFQVIGRDWDQSVSIRSYKLQGSSNYYELRIVLIILEETDLEGSRKCKRNRRFSYKENNNTSGKQSLRVDKPGPTENKNTQICPENQEDKNINQYKKIKDDTINQINEQDSNKHLENVIDKQKLQFEETINKCEDILNKLNIMDNKHIYSRKREFHNDLNTVKKKFEQTLNESRESLQINGYNECKFSELLSNCLKHTEEWIKIMKKIKKDLDTKNTKKYSSNSSFQSESDLERPVIMTTGIKKKLNELIEYMICKNENIKCNKIKHSREISNLKNMNYVVSEICDAIVKKIREEV